MPSDLRAMPKVHVCQISCACCLTMHRTWSQTHCSLILEWGLIDPWAKDLGCVFLQWVKAEAETCRSDLLSEA